jgi:diphthamide biosynthesis enzyme Dph1/Dph2-like protein
MSLSLDLELEKLYSAILKTKAKTVLVQLPDGLKPRAEEIQTETKKKFPNLKLTFWLGSCYGACDIPKVEGFDLFVQFGHSEWR